MAVLPVNNNRPQENGRPDFHCDEQLFARFPNRHGDHLKGRRSGDQHHGGNRRHDDRDSHKDNDRRHGDRHDDRDRRKENHSCPCWRFGLISDRHNLNINNNPSQVVFSVLSSLIY